MSSRRVENQPKNMRKMPIAVSLLLGLLAYYVIMILAAFLFQRRLLFLPGSRQPGVVDVAQAGLRFWPSQQEFRGYLSESTATDPRGTILIFHGNAATAFERLHYIETLAPLDFNVILTEYPGYAGREGTLSESAFVSDACESIRLAREQFSGPLYLVGESLGCGVAASAAAATNIPVDGLVLITPWDSLPDLAQTRFWYLPVRRLMLDTFDSVRNLADFDKPVAVAVAREDETIPRRHSMRLYNSLTCPGRLWEFPGADHNSWPDQADRNWWRQVMEFVTGSND